MKIGIITHYYESNNYGGNLQAYALVKAVEKYCGQSAEQISFDFNSSKPKNCVQLGEVVKILKRPKRTIMSLIRLYFEGKPIDMKPLKNTIDMFLQNKYNRRDVSILRFNKSIPHSRLIYTEDTIEKSLDQYDVFITGSDQVWSGISEAFTLGFVKNKVKMSYAASIGRNAVNFSHRLFLSERINDFSAISVRSETDYNIISSLTKKKVEITVDPVLLLTSDDWDSIIPSFSKHDRKYVFCYFLGDSREVKKAVRTFAKEKKLKIIFIPNFKDNENGFVENDLLLGRKGRYDVSPGDFVGLIKNAEYVFTDSFHCVVFSMIYNKDFYVFDRVSKWGKMSSRITDLLNDMGMKERFLFLEEANHLLTKIRDICEIDYSKYNLIINEKRGKCIEFLKNGIGQQKGEKE